jgi:hypothetical protein
MASGVVVWLRFIVLHEHLPHASRSTYAPYRGTSSANSIMLNPCAETADSPCMVVVAFDSCKLASKQACAHSQRRSSNQHGCAVGTMARIISEHLAAPELSTKHPQRASKTVFRSCRSTRTQIMHFESYRDPRIIDLKNMASTCEDHGIITRLQPSQIQVRWERECIMYVTLLEAHVAR